VLLIAPNQVADGLRGEADRLGHLRCAGAVGKVKQCQGAEDNADLVDAALEQPAQFSTVRFREFEAQGGASHTLVWSKTKPNRNDL